MSKKINHRRGSERLQDNGPRFESHIPNAGSNSTHVARARAAWKRLANRTERHLGQTSVKFHGTTRTRPDGKVD